MRPLIGLRHYIDLLNPTQLVNLARKSALARPIRGRPWGALLWMRILIVLTLKPEWLVAPSQLEKAEDFLEGLAIDAIGLALVAQGCAHVDLLRHLVEPSRLVPAC